AVRWLPLEANGAAAARAVESLPVHPTLPKIRSTGRVGSAAFVAMDFPDGKLLGTELGTPFSLERVRKLGEEIADALATMHAQDVVHGELSADSVLLCSDRSILWDMPLVLANRLTDRRGEERMLSQLPRIAPYLSPERARGIPALPSSDIYALGAILAQLLGAKAPSAVSTLTLLNQLAGGEWKPEVPADAPAVLRTVIGRMLMVDPRARPTAREVSDRLKHALETPAITAPEMPAVVLPYSEMPAVRSVPAVADDVQMLPPPLPPKNAAETRGDVETVIPTSMQIPVSAETRDPKKSGPVVVSGRTLPFGMVVPEALKEVASAAALANAPELSARESSDERGGVREDAAVDARSDDRAREIAPTNPEMVRATPVAPRRSKLPWIFLAAASLAAIVTLSALLMRSSRPAPVKELPAIVSPVVVVQPAPVKNADDDMLEPLVPAETQVKAVAVAPSVAEKHQAEHKEVVKPLPAPVTAKKSVRKPAHVAAAQPKATKDESVEAIKSTNLGDFDFLTKDTPKPTAELKRPQF
ncbi:MAG: serine/threonine protein kinase, partial [Myxococcaceae bacterium]